MIRKIPRPGTEIKLFSLHFLKLQRDLFRERDQSILTRHLHEVHANAKSLCSRRSVEQPQDTKGYQRLSYDLSRDSPRRYAIARTRKKNSRLSLLRRAQALLKVNIISSTSRCSCKLSCRFSPRCLQQCSVWHGRMGLVWLTLADKNKDMVRIFYRHFTKRLGSDVQQFLAISFN